MDSVYAVAAVLVDRKMIELLVSSGFGKSSGVRL
jgi:hypothetical protein